MIDKTVDDFIKKQKKHNTPETFIAKAAENAEYVTCSTHPCQFSHPYANQDKKLRITPIVFFGKYSPDGYVRSGNVKTQNCFDMYGSASFAATMKFLTLQMSNGRSVLENIKDNTVEGKELLKASGKDLESLRENFLKVFKQSDSQITSSKIKQVYFPLGNGQYHLLSLLTPSPIVYELKNRLAAINEDARKKKKLIKQGEITEPFKEIFMLKKLKYGGTQPQNISKLNTENGGISRLLHSAPPTLEDLRIRLPKNDFFKECLNVHAFKREFDGLRKLFTLPQNSAIPLEKIRKYRNRMLEDIVLSIAERAFTVREALKKFPESLKEEQRIWLNKDENVRINETNHWENKIIEDMAGWIIENLRRYRNILLGDAEKSAIKNELQNLKELWK